MTSSLAVARFRPDSRILRDAAWRAGLVLVAEAGVVLGLPAWALTPLSVMAAVVTAVFVLRRFRRSEPIHALLAALGIVIAVTMSLGLLLSLLPWGINTTSWAVGVASIEILLLVVLAYWRAPHAPTRPWLRRIPVAGVAWTVLVVGVLAAALAWSIASANDNQVAPLAIAAVTSEGSVEVTVSSGRDEGPYELQIVSGAGSSTVARDIRIGPGNPASFTVTLPDSTRETVRLVRPGSDDPLRVLILDSTNGAKKVTG